MGKMLLALFLLSVASVNPAILRVNNSLQAAIDRARNGDTLLLAAKEFSAVPRDFADPLCGNCQNEADGAKARTGFIVKDKSLSIVGADRTKTVLVTKAGYGLYFENAGKSSVRNLTVTGGIRDLDGNATDGAIVVRSTRLQVSDCNLSNNTERDTSVIVGVCGLVAREGAEVVIEHCAITNNTWDGIALYRGASAVITDCTISGGRGAGIGVTWDATCVAYRNEVTGFWKGIGSFGTSVVLARNNFVHDNLGWGIIATGESTMDALNNVVRSNGNCGVATWGTDSKGRFINNIIAENGWRDQWVCPCVGVWNYGDWAKWEFRNNIVWGNKKGEYEGIWDQTGSDGNIDVDPLFAAEKSFQLKPESPAWHAGDSAMSNIDGTISHIGVLGGPQGHLRPR